MRYKHNQKQPQLSRLEAFAVGVATGIVLACIVVSNGIGA